MYSCPSSEVTLQPRPPASVIGNGSLNRTVRVLPPGSTLAALRCCSWLSGLAATYFAFASASALGYGLVLPVGEHERTSCFEPWRVHAVFRSSQSRVRYQVPTNGRNQGLPP